MWLIYREEPDTLTVVGGSVIVGAVLLHAFAELRRPARLRAHPEPFV